MITTMVMTETHFRMDYVHIDETFLLRVVVFSGLRLQAHTTDKMHALIVVVDHIVTVFHPW